jgi:hypothetical protein
MTLEWDPDKGPSDSQVDDAMRVLDGDDDAPDSVRTKIGGLS